MELDRETLKMNRKVKTTTVEIVAAIFKMTKTSKTMVMMVKMTMVIMIAIIKMKETLLVKMKMISTAMETNTVINRNSANDNQNENDVNYEYDLSSEDGSNNEYVSSRDGSILDDVDDVIVTRVYASASAHSFFSQDPRSRHIFFID